MAKTPTEDGKRQRGKTQQVMVWTLMGMLIIGLGGFGVTSFSGAKSRLATVGDVEITTNDYARALRTQVNAFSQQIGQPLSMQEALAAEDDAMTAEFDRIELEEIGAGVHERIHAMIDSLPPRIKPWAEKAKVGA